MLSRRRRTFAQSAIAFMIIGLVALLCIVGTTIWLGERAQVYFNDVLKARDVRGATVELRNALLSAETSQRGFIITGNEIYLAPYDTAKNQAQTHIDFLKRLAPYEETQRAFARLEEIITEKFAEMDASINLKREGRDAEIMAQVRSNRGKALMDEANVYFSGVMRGTDERITSSVAEERSNAALLRMVSIAGGIVIVIVVGGATLTVLNYTRALAKARTEVEQRVVERTAELALANSEIKRFAYIVTHDLRAPLVNIMGFTSELQTNLGSVQALVDKTAPKSTSDPVHEEARVAAQVELPEAISFIKSSTVKMNNLINAIMKLSREGQRKLVAERIDLAELITAGAGAIHHQLSEAGGEIATEIDVPFVNTDRLALEQIVGNLLDNAVKYRARSRPLRIRVTAVPASEDKVDITVEDNGRGIATEDLDRVFELFRRSGQQDQPGEGVGLAYVQTLVRSLGGTIEVASTLDEGTRFRVILPRDLPGAAA